MTRKEEGTKLKPIALRYKTAAALLDCSESTVRRMVHKGELRAIKVAGDDRVLLDSIKELAG